MKKIYLAALTLAMTACVSNDDLNPVDNYGYIDVNVSNDPVMVTRAEQPVSDLSGWSITATNTDDQKLTYDLKESNVVPAGKYKIEVSSHSSMEAANEAGEDKLGAPYYTCETSVKGSSYNDQTVNQHVTVIAGRTSTATIYCGSAKNTRIKLDNKLNRDLSEDKFSNVFLSADAVEQRPAVTLFNGNTAYYNPETTINYSISYTYGGSPKQITGLQIQTGGAATEKIITLISNSSGQITVTISVNDQFESSVENLTFDAATGEQV